MSEESEQSRWRREKLAALRAEGNPFPNDFRKDAWVRDLLDRYSADAESLAKETVTAKVAGRLMTRRVMGKTSFAHIQDVSGKMQLFLQRDGLPENVYDEEFRKYDIGDIIAVQGELFHTRTGELTIRVKQIRLLTKALRPLPEKYHGLTDTEMRYRQRYVDLIMNEKTRRVFKTRAAAIHYIREFMVARQFLEVETPMMHPIPGGALARPFKTYHNALDMELFLRVAPELYLKRLVVGGFERVFEINRNFRNEGISTQHNPEFTMMEFYWAYADYHDLIDMTEEMIRGLCRAVTGDTRIDYQGERLDLSRPFERYTLLEAIVRFNKDIDERQLTAIDGITQLAEDLKIEVRNDYGIGKIQMDVFEKSVEKKLIGPTFITAYPVEVSPLSRRNDEHPELSDRFEFFLAGKEIANGFSELNDAQDQAERFEQQAVKKDTGDREAMHYDADYIRALEYGMPPAAGEGIGIDRLIMILTDSPSIRDVVLFPQMRRQS